MALTKLPKNAFGTGSVDDSKIEDGTIQNQELAGSLSEDRLATGTIENASLSNSTITINGTSISLGGSSSVGVDVNWQSVQTTGFTAVAGNGYFVDTTSGAITVTLPASATLGDQIAIKDYAGTFASNNLTIGRNGHNIQGVANDSLISTNRASLLLVYVDSTKGWIYAEESNVGDLQAAAFISATGGTVTTSGDYKIHTFTGDGCFVVSSVGNPIGGGEIVDYLVVAGGGGAGGNAAGGAGGFRESKDSTLSSPHTASPLAATTGLTVSTTTYPITVGAGGSGAVNGTDTPNGSNSVFSTITSAGGGGIDVQCTSPFGVPGFRLHQGKAGGSGGGVVVQLNIVPTRSGGSGNTPPVSPSQGNPGGSGPGPIPSGGTGGGSGGGGATTAGTATSGPYTGPGRPGGAGATTSISGSPTAYAGGGGGGGRNDDQPGEGTQPGGTGGTGGGGPGGSSRPTIPGTAGTANTGGGGGGAGTQDGLSGTGGAGGKGIVIIRYKFQ